MPIFLFALILTVVAGLVAAGGDRMGHRAARRKLRIGNLRPRTVSTIIAVVTGILISLVTFGVVFAIWRDFGEALLRYRDVKSSLADAKGELAEMQGEVADAHLEVDQAQKDSQAAHEEVDKLSSQMSDMRGQTIDLAIAIDKQQKELDAKKAEVSSLQKKKKELDGQITGDNIQIDNLRALKTQLGEDIQKLQAEVETYQEGNLVLARGTNLAYQVVHAGEEANIQPILQSALNRVNVSLTKDGLTIDQDSADAAETFISTYDLHGDAVIIISSARNVFDGTDVLLAFNAMPLTPLVHKGDVLMDVVVGTNTASVKTMGVGTREITVPEKFDVGSLTDFSVILQSEMVAACKQLGFLPNLRSGDYNTPVGKLAQVADDIIARQRPFVIQFVANGPLNALDGLSDAEVYISSPNAPDKPDASATE